MQAGDEELPEKDARRLTVQDKKVQRGRWQMGGRCAAGGFAGVAE